MKAVGHRRGWFTVVPLVAAIVMAASVGASAQSSSKSLRKPFEGLFGSVDTSRVAAGPLSPVNTTVRSLRDSLVALARAQVGRRYVRGGTSPERGFDCSGLVAYVMSRLKFEVPRTARLQSLVGLPVERDTAGLRAGDLLLFGRGRRVSHIGIYVGNGRFIHASSVAGRVVEVPLNRRPAPLIRPWAGARRVVPEHDSLVVARWKTAAR